MRALLAVLCCLSATPAIAQISTQGAKGSTFDSIDPNRTDPGAAYSQGARSHRDRRPSGSDGASNGERGTFNSGPNDPPPPFTPQREK